MTDGRTRGSLRLLLSMGITAGALVIGTIAYARFSLPLSCNVDAVEDASTMLITQMTRYDSVYVSAADGTRYSIDYPVNVMQQILMDTQEIEVPACMRNAKDALIQYMGNVIRAFRAFQAGEADQTIKGYLDEAHEHVRVFLAELTATKKCAPYCFR